MISRKTLRTTAFVGIAFMGLAACGADPLYYWDDYEPLIYDMYLNPGSADSATQIEELTSDIQEAAAKGKATPPGVHAHLGMMYAFEGNHALSRASFLEEKRLYPESATFIDGMLERAYGGSQQ